MKVGNFPGAPAVLCTIVGEAGDTSLGRGEAQVWLLQRKFWSMLHADSSGVTLA